MKLKLRLIATAGEAFINQPFIRIRRLWVLVQELHVRMRRRGIQVVVILLAVLAVIALVPGYPKHPFFQDRIAAVPQRERKANLLMTVADTAQTVLIPAIGLGTSLIVWK